MGVASGVSLARFYHVETKHARKDELMRLQRHLGLLIVTIGALVGGLSLRGANAQTKRLANTFPDLSGLVWVAGDSFLAFHDSKNPDENERPRASMLWLPQSPDGITWNPIELDWPSPQGLSSDLESASRIPGRQAFLFVESGERNEQGQQFRRLFLAECRDRQFQILSFTEMPISVTNVEGTAVAQAGDRMVFIFAERAEGQSSTNIAWTNLQLQPLKLGAFEQATFSPPDFTGPNIRPVSAIETDKFGRLYVASAFDPGDDNGPFRSVIWRIGQIKLDNNGKIRIILDAKPHRLATLDGLKVESLAIREQTDGRLELFAGTDDENYGGTLRLIPLRP
jgi:hypothetical protein